MDLILFVVFLSLSLFLITLGLLKPEHSELAIIGFLFLFLMSFYIINGDIQYKVGVDTNSTYTYDGGNISTIDVVERDVYSTYTSDDLLNHRFGYWLAVVAGVGMFGAFVSIKRTYWGNS